MDAKTALQNISGLLGDYQSFCELFDHEGHGDVDPEGNLDADGGCRFDQYDIDESLKVIGELIRASQNVVDHFQGPIDDDDLSSLDELTIVMLHG